MFTPHRLMAPLFGALAMLSVVFGPVAAPVSAEELDKSQIEQIVKDYLLQNPEVIADALTELDRRQKAAEEAARVAALSDSADILFNSTRQVVLGNSEGNVTMVEFFDYNCGYCKRAHGDMIKLMEEMPNLRVVLKEFPVLGQASIEAAQVAIAVNAIAPEKYGEFHEGLLLQRGRASKESAMKAATDLGLSEEDLNKAISSDIAGQTIEEVYSLANRLGLTGTPSYVIGNEVIMGAVGYDELRGKLAAMESCGTTSC